MLSSPLPRGVPARSPQAGVPSRATSRPIVQKNEEVAESDASGIIQISRALISGGTFAPGVEEEEQSGKANIAVAVEIGKAGFDDHGFLSSRLDPNRS